MTYFRKRIAHYTVACAAKHALLATGMQVAALHADTLGWVMPMRRAALILGKTQRAHGLGDLNHQTGLDFEFVGVKLAEIGKDIA